MLGYYQPEREGVGGEVFPEWEPLTEATLERRERAGTNPNDEPLLETGEELARGIVIDGPHQVSIDTAAAIIGFAVASPAGEYGPFHELGTSHEPIRAALYPALAIVQDDVISAVVPPVLQNIKIISD